MQNETLLVLIAAAVVVIALVVWAATRKRRTAKLVDRFGPEYERAVETLGSKAKAEADLAARAKHRAKLTIRPLSPAEHERFAEAWHRTQESFVDDPSGAVAAADALVAEVMGARGYPMGEFETQAADISVDYPALVENYRAAHRLAAASARGEVDTEDLRRAMVHYRALFTELLEARELEPAPA
jgi:hypothetical protein